LFSTVAIIIFITSSLTQSLDEHEQNCNLGNVLSCLEAGLIHAGNEDDPKNKARAVEFFEKGCNLAQGAGPDAAKVCYFAAQHYQKGVGVEKNIPKARMFYKKSCDFGEERGCGKEDIQVTKSEKKGYKSNLIAANASFGASMWIPDLPDGAKNTAREELS